MTPAGEPRPHAVASNPVKSLMPLTMRPTGLGAGIDKGRPDYTVYCGGWAVGRTYEIRGGPDRLRWFWSPQGLSDSS